MSVTGRRGRGKQWRGARIAVIGTAAAASVPAGAPTIDGSGKFLIPGLWDMHAHAVQFGQASLDLFLTQGVTAIRDMGAERFAEAKDWRDRIAAGRLRGPRMRIASPVVENPRWLAMAKALGERAGTPWTLSERVGPQSVEDAERWVDAIAALGPDHIKVRNWPSAEIGRALVERARRHGLPVAAHGNEPFPRTGLATLEHYIWPPLTISDAERAALWRQFASEGIAVVPTMVTWVTRLEPPETLLARLDAGTFEEYVPPQTRARWRDQLRQFEQETPMDWAGIHRREMRHVAEMHRTGITLLPGSDVGAPLLVPGFSLQDELARLVTIGGMTPHQALRAATLSAARVAGAGDSIGSIETGKIADLVLLTANPLVDIQHTRRIHAVVANGRIFTRADLDRMLASARH